MAATVWSFFPLRSWGLPPEFYLPVAHSAWPFTEAGQGLFHSVVHVKLAGWSRMDLTPLIHLLLCWVFLVNCLIFRDRSHLALMFCQPYDILKNFITIFGTISTSDSISAFFPRKCMAVLGIFSTFPIPYKHCGENLFYQCLLLLYITYPSTLLRSCPLKRATFSGYL